MEWDVESAFEFLRTNYPLKKSSTALYVTEPGLKGLSAIDFLRSEGETIIVENVDVLNSAIRIGR